jgi:hypothetical protein
MPVILGGNTSIYLASLTPPAPVSFLLDTYPNATVAYSLRKLRSAYSGSAIRVRRSSDNTEQNIGFVSNVLDTASLLTFVGAGSGYITTWYDQSGNAKDAIQATATAQPRIVNTGVLDLVNSKAAIIGDGSNDTLKNISLSLTNPSSIFTVINKVGTTNYFGLYSNSGLLSGSFSLTATGYLMYQNGATVTPTYANNNQSLLVAKTATTGTDWELYGNNTTVLNSGENIGTSIGSIVSLFSRASTVANQNFANMYMQEYIVWNSNQMTNRTGIQTEINTYYNI